MSRRPKKVYISVLISDPPREHIEFLEARVQALEEELEEQKALRRQAVERVVEIEKQRLALAKELEESKAVAPGTHYPWAIPCNWSADFGRKGT